MKKSEDGLWYKCSACGEISYHKVVIENYYTCPKCRSNFRIGSKEWIEILAEPNTFEEHFSEIKSDDPLGFKDTVKYPKRLKEIEKKTSLSEAVKCGTCYIGPFKAGLGVMDFSFMGGSMGSAVGERITLLIEKCIREGMPLIMVCASGGARMQESIFSLMQMVKTSASLKLLSDARIPYISVLTHPTTGGVSASFAFLGDVIIAEPNALIGFAGPRVIEQTIRQKLPDGFQRSEFLLEKGQIDMIVERRNIKDTLVKILKILYKKT